MKHKLATIALLATTGLATSTLGAQPALGARCVSGADVRGQVSAFVHSLHDDVPDAETRHAVKRALVESVRTARGAHADTPAEERGLGHQISVLARQLGDAEDAVARDAIKTAIHALQEQKRADHFTERDARRMERDLRHLKHSVVATTDSRGEGRAVAAFVHDLMAQFDC